MKKTIPTIIMLGLAMAFLGHFALIVHYGSILIQEPNKIILATEVMLLVTVIIYGIYNLVEIIREHKRHEHIESNT